MRLTRWVAALLGLVILLLAGLAWLAMGMGPLGALSLPFVRVAASPCLLALQADAAALDAARFSQALDAYAGSNGFHDEDGGSGPRRLASYAGPGTLNLLAVTDARQVTVQLFKEGRARAPYTREVEAAATTFTGAGLHQVDCR